LGCSLKGDVELTKKIKNKKESGEWLRDPLAETPLGPTKCERLCHPKLVVSATPIWVYKVVEPLPWDTWVVWYLISAECG
jgi:hypothetical protein